MNSKLSTMRAISPNRTSPRNHGIDTLTIHCTVGQVSAEWICQEFSRAEKEASCNYGIGTDGRVVTIVDEGDRSWCSSSQSNDHRAITIECASDSFAPYKINQKVWDSLIRLCADICQRNSKNRLLWLGNKEKTLAYTPKTGEMVMTVHRWFANKSCPGDYIFNRLGTIAAQVNEILEEDSQMLSYEDFKKYMERYNQEQAKKPIAKWAEAGVAKVEQAGIMSRDSSGNFRPCSDITRQELAVSQAAILRRLEEHEKRVGEQ